MSILTDEQILALNEGEIYFSESPSKYPKVHGTQYHCGAPGLLKFARALLARAAHPSAATRGLTDADIDTIAESMPGGMDGFHKGWGWRNFARAVEAEVLAAQPDHSGDGEKAPCELCKGVGAIGMPGQHCFACDGSGESKFHQAAAVPQDGGDERAAFEVAFRAAHEFSNQANQLEFRKGWEAGIMFEQAALAQKAVSVRDDGNEREAAKRLIQRHANAARALEHMYTEKNVARLKLIGEELEAALAQKAVPVAVVGPKFAKGQTVFCRSVGKGLTPLTVTRIDEISDTYVYRVQGSGGWYSFNESMLAAGIPAATHPAPIASSEEEAVPVAWMYTVRGAIHLERVRLDHFYRDYSGDPSGTYIKGVPLYIHPAAAQPSRAEVP